MSSFADLHSGAVSVRVNQHESACVSFLISFPWLEPAAVIRVLSCRIAVASFTGRRFLLVYS